MTSISGPHLNHIQGEKAQGLVVILHGYGASGDNLISLGEEWQADLPTLDFVAPNGIYPWEGGLLGGYQWFSLVDWNQKRIEQDMDRIRPQLIHFLDQELARRNLTYQDLVLVGFSQGAILALDVGLHGKGAPAGIVAYSGGYISTKNIKHADVPVLLIHGADDAVLASESSLDAHTTFQTTGVNSQLHILEDLEHSIDHRGVMLGAEFLKKNLIP